LIICNLPAGNWRIQEAKRRFQSIVIGGEVLQISFFVSYGETKFRQGSSMHKGDMQKSRLLFQGRSTVIFPKKCEEAGV
jgi:hypothetical protein